MPKFIIISPNVGYESASELAHQMKVPYEDPFKTDNRDFRKYDFVFKYGFSRPIKANKVFNKSKHIELSRNKLKTLAAFKDSQFTIPYTENKEEAATWVGVGKSGAVARNVVDGDNGAGVEFCFTKKDFDKAPAIFWTKYIPHTNEFRVNIWRDQVVSIYEKKTNGKYFKFCLFKGQEQHPQLVELAKEIYKRIGLDWCGADIVRDKQGNLYLLEVNSAPILFPYTMKKLITILEKEME